jgi:hypothetical protein
MISVCGEHASNVKRWRDGQMAAALVRGRDGRGRQAIPVDNSAG